MEGIVVIAVIVGLALILGVKPIMIGFAAVCFAGLFLLFLVIFFIVFFFKMIGSEKKEAEFTKIGKRSPEARFNLAFYKIDGKEYPNIFPEEGIMEKMLYKTDKKYYVRLNKKGYVFDRFATTTCTVGFTLSVFLIVAAATIALTIL